MTDFQYKRAPITEAVIGINFAERIDEDTLISVDKKYAPHYPQNQTLSDVNVMLNVNSNDPSPKTNVAKEDYYRRSSDDMTQILLLRRDSIIFSQLAPYLGWSKYIERFKRDWKIWKRVVKHRTISRVGVRFLNRIDIPVEKQIVKYEDYLNIYPKIPSSFEPINAYAIQTTRQLDNGCSVNMNSAVVPSPLLNHLSFLLDIDVYSIKPPQSDNDLIELLNSIRLKKNQMFEDCITDNARRLFNE